MTVSTRVLQISEIAADRRYAVVGGPFGSKLGRKDYTVEGVPVLRGSNLPFEKRIDLTDLVFVSAEKVEKDLFGNLAHPGDIVVTQRGTLGQVGLIPMDSIFERFVVSQSQMKLTVDAAKADPRFLYYYLKSPVTTKRLIDRASSSGVPHINLEVFRHFDVELPDLNTQRSVADVLTCFDDLIENNRRRVAILEEAARLLYREWFVHLRFPGHAEVELVDSHLGPIPKGWLVGDFSDLVSEIRETLAPEEIPANTPVVGLEHLPRRSTTLHEWQISSDVGSRRKIFAEGDILFGKIRPYFHKVVDAPVSGCASTDAIVFRPKDGLLRCRALAVASSDDFVGVATATSNGTKMPRANTEILMTYGVPHPTQDVERAFSEIVGPMDSLRRALARQSKRLHEARDLLLPRLVSGELDVSELDLGLAAV